MSFDRRLAERQMNRTCMFDPTTILAHYLTKGNRKMSVAALFSRPSKSAAPGDSG